MNAPVWRHIPTDTRFRILGAKITSAGRSVFVVKESGGPERLFLADADSWEAPGGRSEVEGIFTEFNNPVREARRVKAKHKEASQGLRRRNSDIASDEQVEDPEMTAEDGEELSSCEEDAGQLSDAIGAEDCEGHASLEAITELKLQSEENDEGDD